MRIRKDCPKISLIDIFPIWMIAIIYSSLFRGLKVIPMVSILKVGYVRLKC